METLENPNKLTFLKWQKVGDELDVTITEAPVFDKPNQFGSKDSSFRAVITGTEDRVQVPMPVDLKEKVKGIADRIALGETRLVIKYTGTKPMKGKAPMKVFDVKVEGLIAF